MAPIHGHASDYHNGRRGSSSHNGGRTRKATASKGLISSSQVTAEDGTPSPGDMDTATTGSFFAFQSGNSEGGDSMGGLGPEGRGHRRHGSKSASMSSGFSGVAGVGGGGIGGGSMNGAHSFHSRRSSAGSRAGSRTSSRTGSSRSRSPRRSPSEEATEDAAASYDMASRSGTVSRAIASGAMAGVSRMTSRGENVRAGSRPSTARGVGIPPTGNRRTGFAQFLSAKDSVDEIDTGATSPSSKSARKPKGDIRKAWGLREESMESEGSIQFRTSEAFKHQPIPYGDRRGVRQDRELAPPSPQPAPKTKSPATAAPAAEAGGVKRYSWATSIDSQEEEEEEYAPRTPEHGRGGAPSYSTRQSMGSEDDTACPSPAAINAILNSRIGAKRRGDMVDQYAIGVVNRRPPAAGAALAGIRAAWGTSMGGSQDDMACPSPTAVEAIRNSRVQGAYSRGVVDEEGGEAEPDYVDPRSLEPGVPGSRRRPMGGDTLAGVRAAWGTSMGGSQDDIICPAPSAVHMVRQSRSAAKSAPVKVYLSDDSYSEEEYAHSRSVEPGIVDGRRRPGGGDAMSGSHEDDLVCPPSPATVNAILNSRVGAVYSRGGDGGRSTASKPPQARPPKIVSSPVTSRRSRSERPRSERPRSERREGGGGSGSSSAGRGRVSGGVRGGGNDAASARGGRGGTQASRDHAAGTRRGETAGSRDRNAGRRDQTARGRDQPTRGHDQSARGRGQPARGREQPSRGPGQHAGNRGDEAAGASRVVTATRRKWSPGQSNVFDSSGSSSSDDEGKPRGLRGVQILDSNPADAGMRSIGSSIRGGGAAAGSRGGGVGGGGRRAAGASHGYRGPGGGGGGVPTVGSSIVGLVTGGGGGNAAARVPRRETLKGMPGFSRGLSEDDSEYAFEHARD